MTITSDALQQARAGLKSATRDRPLVEKFTAIRGLNPKRSSANVQATLTDDQIQVLQSLIPRSSPSVQVTTNVAPSTFPRGGTRVEMVFRTTFKAKVQPQAPYRVIRFVRATEISRKFNEITEKYTAPGYVYYQENPRIKNVRAADAPDRNAMHASLLRCFAKAKWSFDGPALEFKGGRMYNVDTPGTMYSQLPYGMMADFLIALYDEDKRQILEAGRAAAWLFVPVDWPRTTPTFARTL